ncbi:efflux RND transporter permease subunit [Microbacterium betulae]|uniref:Efflux RND transporter permease subunit n=1 Tax=Microbacterium betulae TaxID=2981139 RepID=A0AA97FFP5_9MICO|nr:efflux RND transporter permease subunit [Microbacterium sp. AB]WOF22686.1 efflux RND transporter permease subunit [Microbacterium sp. AB]
MSKLAILSLKNRALIALVTICAAVFGGLSLTSLKQELIPSIELPALIVMTTYPGASPEVVEADVSTPIETAIQSVPDLESSTATSTTNASIVQATFAYGSNLATAEQKMQQAITRISSQLPDDVEPQVLSVSIDDLPVIQVAVSGIGDADAAQAQLENVVVPDIEDVDGVGAAELVGGVGQRITITPDAAALAANGLTQQAISDALEQNGTLFPGGEITEDGSTLTVQTGEKITSVDQLSALPLVSSASPTPDPTTGEVIVPPVVTIADVADVAQTDDPTTTLSRVNGEDAISISITKLPAANTVEVSDGVQAVLADLRETLPDAEFTVVFDQAPFIVQSIETLATEGLLGLVFAVLVILVFLLSIRSTLVTAISIPTSVLITFIGMQAFGYSLNMLTLGALTISIGRVVDDSIVVIENIKRHYVGGADKGDAIRLAVREVAGAITASTITTVAVFLPIVFVGDMVGELFRPFALTVSIAMAASLLVALTIVPVLAYWFMRPGKPLLDAEGARIDPEHPDAPPSRLQRSYLPILRWTLRHSVVTLLLAVLVLGGTVALAPFMKVNFLGDTGQNTLTISQDLGDTASLETKDEAAQRVEEALDGIDGIETVQVSVGSSGSALADAFSGGAGVTYSVMTGDGVDQEALRAEVQGELSALDGVGDLTVSAAAGFGSTDIAVSVEAPTSDALAAATQAIVDELDGRDGIGAVTDDLAASLPYIAVEVDREAAAAAGLSEAAVGAIVSSSMQPQQAGSIELDETSLTVYIAAEDPPATVQELRELQIPTATGVVPLQDLAAVEETESPSSITTVQGRRTATVTVPPATDDLAVATASANAAVAAADLPDGATATVGGVAEDQADAFSQLGLAMLAAILIVYVVMVATFKSLRQPILLLVSVPFAATGAILLQVASGVPLGVASLIGVLMLIGIVVTNAIVLIDLVNQYRERGLSARDATLAGASMRLRPILMTALATIFALTPMALGITGHGGFISQPLAIVVIGGLVSSTVLTLIVLPTLYNLVEGAKERRAARRAGHGDGSDGGTGPDGREPGGADHGAVAESRVVVPAGAGVGPSGAGVVSAAGADAGPGASAASGAEPLLGRPADEDIPPLRADDPAPVYIPPVVTARSSSPTSGGLPSAAPVQHRPR